MGHAAEDGDAAWETCTDCLLDAGMASMAPLILTKEAIKPKRKRKKMKRTEVSASDTERLHSYCCLLVMSSDSHPDFKRDW